VGTGQTPRRLDIQVLRGIAVLAVLTFHAGGALMPSGYLGVDVFFVISGFLVGGHVLRGVTSGEFGLRAFYWRRVRRIAPAALTTLLATTILSAAILTASQWRDYLLQLLGALTFSANFFLLQQGGYFDPEIEVRPLLHFWSLAIEEQFYMLFPLALLLLPRSARIPAIFLAAALSMGLFAWTKWSGLYPGAAFFLLPTRLWSLLTGVLIAALMQRWPGIEGPLVIKFGASMAVGAALAAGTAGAAEYLAAVFGTALLLIGKGDWISPNLFSQAFGKIGDISYSLYLVHFPLLAFAANLYAGAAPTAVILGIIALSFLLATMQHRYVELPFLRCAASALSLRNFLSAGICALVAFVLVLPQNWSRPGSRLETSVAPPVLGLAKDCWRGVLELGQGPCRTSPDPAVAIWGDSFAMHLVPGVVVHLGGAPGLAQFTMPSCAPVPDVAELERGQLGYGPECLAFNTAVLDHILGSPSIRIVVLASSWVILSRDRTRRLLTPYGERELTLEARVTALRDAVLQLRRSGRTVFLVGPTPMEALGTFDPALCNLRELEERPLFREGGCSVSRDLFWERMPQVTRSLDRAAAGGAPPFLIEEALCSGNACATRAGSTLIYRDTNHLSKEGSVLVANWTGLGDAIVQALDARQPGAAPGL
jgi:peptidoglycan/LPS O-acetylase OafA/YrhL